MGIQTWKHQWDVFTAKWRQEDQKPVKKVGAKSSNVFSTNIILFQLRKGICISSQRGSDQRQALLPASPNILFYCDNKKYLNDTSYSVNSKASQWKLCHEADSIQSHWVVLSNNDSDTWWQSSQNGTESLLAEEKASLTDRNSPRRQDVTVWCWAVQMKEPQIYLVDKRWRSSLFSWHRGKWLILNTNTKKTEGKWFEREEQFHLPARLAASRYASR